MSNKPSHYLNVVTGENENSEYTRVAALWPTSKGGYAGTVAGVTIPAGSRLVITAAKSAAGDTNGGQQ